MKTNHKRIIDLYKRGLIGEDTPDRIVESLINENICVKLPLSACPFRNAHLYNVGDSFMRPWVGTNSILTIVGIDLKNREYICHSSLFTCGERNTTIRVSFSDDYRLQPVCGCSCCQCCNRMAFCDLCNRPIFGVGDRIKWSYDKDSAVLVVDDIDLCGKRYHVHNGDYRFTIPFKNNDLLTLISSACPVSCCNPCYCCKCRCCNR